MCSIKWNVHHQTFFGQRIPKASQRDDEKRSLMIHSNAHMLTNWRNVSTLFPVHSIQFTSILFHFYSRHRYQQHQRQRRHDQHQHHHKIVHTAARSQSSTQLTTDLPGKIIGREEVIGYFVNRNQWTNNVTWILHKFIIRANGVWMELKINQHLIRCYIRKTNAVYKAACVRILFSRNVELQIGRCCCCCRRCLFALLLQLFQLLSLVFFSSLNFFSSSFFHILRYWIFMFA